MEVLRNIKSLDVEVIRDKTWRNQIGRAYYYYYGDVTWVRYVAELFCISQMPPVFMGPSQRRLLFGYPTDRTRLVPTLTRLCQRFSLESAFGFLSAARINKTPGER